MNRDMQLHDCELSAVNQIDGSTSIVFSTAYIHESMGVPGFDPGLIWTQVAMITIEGTTPVSLAVEPPIWVLGGSLRIGQTIHEEFIPAGGQFEGEAEFVIVLSTEDGSDGGTLKVKGNGVKIELLGEQSEVEDFNEYPRRSIE